MEPGGQSASGTNRMRANRKVLESKCTSCRQAFTFGEEVYSCQACGGYHHAACWQAGAGCLGPRDGAPAARAAVVAAPVPAVEPTVPAPSAGHGTAVTCPSCGLQSSGSAFCSECGYDLRTLTSFEVAIAPPEVPPPAQAQPAIRVPAADEQACPQCAEIIKKDALKCRFCGRTLHELAQQEVPAYVVAEMDSMANQALTYSIIGIFICAPILGSVAISKGNKAIQLMENYPMYVGPRGKAQAGRIIGWIDIILFAIGIIGMLSR